MAGAARFAFASVWRVGFYRAERLPTRCIIQQLAGTVPIESKRISRQSRDALPLKYILGNWLNG